MLNQTHFSIAVVVPIVRQKQLKTDWNKQTVWFIYLLLNCLREIWKSVFNVELRFALLFSTKIVFFKIKVAKLKQ